MTLEQIAALGRKVSWFLGLFADCFGRRDARRLLTVYVKGQLSNLLRKNVEAIALRAKTAPRTLQRFLESIKWDEEKLRNRCQQIIMKDHAHDEAIGCVDESGTAKSGKDTVGVNRQWNGNRGKVDNGCIPVLRCCDCLITRCFVEWSFGIQLIGTSGGGSSASPGFVACGPGFACGGFACPSGW